MKKYLRCILFSFGFSIGGVIHSFADSPVIAVGESVEIVEMVEENKPEEAATPCEILTESEQALLAQLVEAEAGDQDLLGRRYVVDVVFNRRDSAQFPNTIEGVIYQNHQFSVIKNGRFDRVAGSISPESWEAVDLECQERSNREFLYFGMKKCRWTKNHFRHQDHWFGW